MDQTKGIFKNVPQVWLDAYNAAWDGSCKDSETRDMCARSAANEAMENLRLDKTLPTVEFSMAVIKASYEKGSGKMCFRMVASDIEKDLYDTQMSMELFSDFTRRIEQNLPVPEPFAEILHEDGWNGGMPYLSIAHYKSAGGRNVPGKFDKIYVDGKSLKATGELYDTNIGRATFRSLCTDLYGQSEYEHKIRASIGFLDLKHSHGDFIFERKSLTDVCPQCSEGVGNKMFLAGQLLHIAMTREPVNPRTSMEVDMAKVIHSKREDAESVVGDEIVDLDLQEQSLIASAVVTRSDEGVIVTDTVEIPQVDENPQPVAETPEPVVNSDPVDVAVASLQSKLDKARTLPKDQALALLQSELQAVNETVKREFETPVSPEMSMVLQSLQGISDRIQEVAETVTSLTTDVAILKEAQKTGVVTQSTKPTVPSVPAPRAAQITPHTLRQINQNAEANRSVAATTKPNQIEELARRSVYGK